MPPPPPPPMPAMPATPPSPDPVRLEENGEMFTTPESTGVTVLMNVVMTLTHMLLGAVALSAFLFANLFSGSNSLTQHIYLCVIGYIILMSQAILTFSPHNGWANSLKYPRKRVVHWIMQISGSALAIAGSIVRFTDLADHLQTAHGVLGLIALILTVVSLVGGVANLLFPKRMSTLLLRTLHACVGAITLSVAFICLIFAFNTLYRDTMGDENANLCIALTVVALVGTLTSVLINMTKRVLRR